jgi:hypothetical protein
MITPTCINKFISIDKKGNLIQILLTDSDRLVCKLNDKIVKYSFNL